MPTRAENGPATEKTRTKLITKAKSSPIQSANQHGTGYSISEEPEEECEDANSNPRCPYITEIHQSQEDMRIVKTALVGEDLQGGLVKRVSDIEGKLKRRWTPKDWGALLTGVAALILALVAYWNSLPH